MKKEIYVTFDECRKDIVMEVLSPYMMELDDPLYKGGTYMAKIQATLHEWTAIRNCLVAR